jgi:TonB family protein
MDPVSEVLVARARGGENWTPPAILSLFAHCTVLAILIMIPSAWIGPRDQPKVVMTISLGGTPGPNQGMTLEGGRAVQAAPLEARPARRAEPAPAPQAPKMVLPVPQPKVRARPTAKQAPPDAKGTQVPQGTETRAGSTRTDTGARGMGFGLSTGGGGGTGGYLDVGNFCCPEYLTTMVELIRRNWNSRQEVPGEVLMKFVIQRGGAITGIEVERSSGYAVLDLNAQRTLALTGKLPPLPAAFPDNQLTVHLSFQYQR